MKLNLALIGASVLALSGCVAYDDAYRTTGHVGEGYGTYRGDRVYSESRTRVVEDRAGNIYRIYPDGTSVLINRGGYAPYGNYPGSSYGGYSSYGYGYGGYSNSPYGYGGYSSYPRGTYAQPPRIYRPSRPGQPNPRPTHPGQPLPNAGTSTPPPVVVIPPPSFTPRTESASSRVDRAEARRESHKSRELRGTQEP